MIYSGRPQDIRSGCKVFTIQQSQGATDQIPNKIHCRCLESETDIASIFGVVGMQVLLPGRVGFMPFCPGTELGLFFFEITSSRSQFNYGVRQLMSILLGERDGWAGLSNVCRFQSIGKQSWYESNDMRTLNCTFYKENAKI